MNTFGISNYHAIKEANIIIDGLTVLTGVNGSGKSTLSRWLFYLVNGMHNFERSMRNNFIHSLVDEIYKLYRFFRNTRYGTNYSIHRERLMASARSVEFNEDALGDAYTAFVLQAERDLTEYVQRASESEKDRLLVYLNENKVGTRVRRDFSALDVVNAYITYCYQLYDEGLEGLKERISECSLVDLKNTIRAEYNEENTMPQEISFLEGEIPLIDSDKFTPPLFLSRAIYVDSPMAVASERTFSDNLWDRFRDLLVSPNKDADINDGQMRHIIQQIIGGKIELVTDSVGFSDELHFISNSGVDIKIEDAATGIKSFAYLSRLLENGWLDKETLLLIDEPEAHLHPQWIVEFARLLVQIHKRMGVKIMIASHNPDMIAAIQSIADKEGVLGRTKFYLAERDIDTLNYRFVDKGTEIGDIFESFNIAMSRIQEYGTGLI